MVSTSLIFSRFILTPKWRNSGTTPTKQMTISLQWTRTTSDEPLQFPVSYIKEPTSQVHTQSLFIGPQSITLSQTINIPLGDNVVGTTLDLFKCGNEKIFIWGKVEYEDVFGKKHVSESCYYLQFIINSIYEPILINYIQSGSQNSYREIG